MEIDKQYPTNLIVSRNIQAKVIRQSSNVSIDNQSDDLNQNTNEPRGKLNYGIKRWNGLSKGQKITLRLIEEVIQQIL